MKSKKNFYINMVDLDGEKEMQLQLYYENGKLCFGEDTTIALFTRGLVLIVDQYHDTMQRVEYREKRNLKNGKK